MQTYEVMLNHACKQSVDMHTHTMETIYISSIDLLILMEFLLIIEASLSVKYPYMNKLYWSVPKLIDKTPQTYMQKCNSLNMGPLLQWYMYNMFLCL